MFCVHEAERGRERVRLFACVMMEIQKSNEKPSSFSCLRGSVQTRSTDVTICTLIHPCTSPYYLSFCKIFKMTSLRNFNLLGSRRTASRNFFFFFFLSAETYSKRWDTISLTPSASLNPHFPRWRSTVIVLEAEMIFSEDPLAAPHLYTYWIVRAKSDWALVPAIHSEENWPPNPLAMLLKCGNQTHISHW